MFAQLMINQAKNATDQESEDQFKLCHYYLESFLNALEYLYNERNMTTINDFKRQLRDIFM